MFSIHYSSDKTDFNDRVDLPLQFDKIATFVIIDDFKPVKSVS